MDILKTLEARQKAEFEAEAKTDDNGTTVVYDSGFDREKYSDFTNRTLVPQVARKVASKMSANPYTFEVLKENVEINQLLQKINADIDFNRIGYILEYKLSLEGNSALIIEKSSEDRFSVFVP
ncbi:unnamed protein product, partial [marine sediment metagenome]